MTVDEGTGSVTLRASFPNPERVLLPGMYVHASFPQGVADSGILAPQPAIMHDTKGILTSLWSTRITPWRSKPLPPAR